MKYTHTKSTPALSALDTDIVEFLDSAKTDFYSNLHNFAGMENDIIIYKNRSILALVSACECYTLNAVKGRLGHPLDVCSIIRHVHYRIDGTTNRELSDAAIVFMSDLLCYKAYTARNTGPKAKVHKLHPKTTGTTASITNNNTK